jgi:hypothetical protein
LTPSIYQAIHWLLQAWKQCVTAQTIQNCWRKSGLLSPSTIADVAQNDVDASNTAAEAVSDELEDEDVQPEVDLALLGLANAIDDLQTLAMQRS